MSELREVTKVLIPILDDNKQPTTDFLHGRPLLRVSVWINGELVLSNGYGLVDTGSRRSAICPSKIGTNVPDDEIPNYNSSGLSTTGVFRIASIQVEHFRAVPVELSLFTGSQHFDVIIGRDVLRLCRLVMDYTTQTFTLDMS
ncbi:pepsin/retropepsin-like aspartic protease family protein [Bradyrhizobium diazoefficiens]